LQVTNTSLTIVNKQIGELKSILYGNGNDLMGNLYDCGFLFLDIVRFKEQFNA
jgi:hypothetical protein